MEEEMTKHTVAMTDRQTELYLSASKASRAAVVAQIKATIRSLSDRGGEAVLVTTANGYPAWRDAT